MSPHTKGPGFCIRSTKILSQMELSKSITKNGVGSGALGAVLSARRAVVIAEGLWSGRRSGGVHRARRGSAVRVPHGHKPCRRVLARRATQVTNVH